MKLILFDIDGTLVDTGGSGKRAFAAALLEFFGFQGGLQGIKLDGKTDPLILREALGQRKISDLPAGGELERFVSRYVDLLKEELAANPSHYQILPKVPDLLTALDRRSDVLVGLATGNVEQGALAKLGPGDLNRFFVCGGYGSDSESRTTLIQTAIQRAESISATDFKRVIVIGDTPNDIIHGRAAGAETIGVATGRYDLQYLESFQPDLLLESFDPIDRLLQFVESGSRAGGATHR